MRYPRTHRGDISREPAFFRQGLKRTSALGIWEGERMGFAGHLCSRSDSRGRNCRYLRAIVPSLLTQSPREELMAEPCSSVDHTTVCGVGRRTEDPIRVTKGKWLIVSLGAP